MRGFSCVILLGVLIFSVISCEDSPIYSDKVSVEGTWNYSDSLFFELPATDTTFPYDLVYEIVHNTDYPFENIYLNAVTQYPSGRSTSEIINVDLADKGGSWLGSCSGNTCTRKALVRNYFAFSEAGVYNVAIAQHTRTENLSGIKSIGMSLWPSAIETVEE